VEAAQQAAQIDRRNVRAEFEPHFTAESIVRAYLTAYRSDGQCRIPSCQRHVGKEGGASDCGHRKTGASGSDTESRDGKSHDFSAGYQAVRVTSEKREGHPIADIVTEKLNWSASLK
jgi:hypothetical protein